MRLNGLMISIQLPAKWIKQTRSCGDRRLTVGVALLAELIAHRATLLTGETGSHDWTERALDGRTPDGGERARSAALGLRVQAALTAQRRLATGGHDLRAVMAARPVSRILQANNHLAGARGLGSHTCCVGGWRRWGSRLGGGREGIRSIGGTSIVCGLLILSLHELVLVLVCARLLVAPDCGQATDKGRVMFETANWFHCGY